MGTQAADEDGIFTDYNGTSEALLGLVDKYLSTSIADDASTGGFTAPDASEEAVATSSATIAKMQAALAEAKASQAEKVAALALITAANTASQAEEPTDSTDEAAAVTAADADVAALEAAIAAASGTAAVEDVASDTMISSRLRIQIDANAESDAGVTFGARVRIQSGEGAAAAINAARFYAKSGGFEVGVGNIYGALENMPGTYPVQIGFTDFGDNTAVGGRDAYSSGGLGASGSNGVEAIYSMGDFKAHVSASDTNNRVAAAASYTTNGWTFAVGAQDSDLATDNEAVATIGGTIGGATIGLAYADNGTAGTRTVLSGSFAAGAATTIDAYYTDDELLDDSFGLGVHHSLGGGVTLQAGVGENFAGTTQADFGVKFNF